MIKTISAIIALTAFPITPSLYSQEKKKEAPPKKEEIFSKKNSTQKPLSEAEPDIGILLEYISVDHKIANQLLGKYMPKAAGVDEMRNELEGMLDEENAGLVETVWLRARSGNRAKTESTLGVIYPTEFDPPEIPNNVGDVARSIDDRRKTSGGYPNVPMTAGNPSAFDKRNVGSTLEVDPVLSTDLTLINLNLAPEIVERLEQQYFIREELEHTARGVENMAMPTFYTIKDTTQMEVAPGKYNLLGIHPPHDDPSKRILVLLRADLISID